MSHLLEKVHLSIPAFHAYGHNAACQVCPYLFCLLQGFVLFVDIMTWDFYRAQLRMSPMRCPGLGLSDGEVLERLWSYLRRFGRMTKEMRPSHRIDILSHALLHYGHKTKEKLGEHSVFLDSLLFA